MAADSIFVKGLVAEVERVAGELKAAANKQRTVVSSHVRGFLGDIEGKVTLPAGVHLTQATHGILVSAEADPIQ